MKIVQIILFVVTSFISALQAGEVILKQNEIVQDLTPVFCGMTEEIRFSVYKYLKLKDFVKLSEINKYEQGIIEKDIENLIISFAIDKQIAREQVPCLKRTFGTLRNLIRYVPINFMNKTYTEIEKMVKSREGKTNLEKTEILLTDNLYIFPFYDEVKLMIDYKYDHPLSFQYPNYQLEFRSFKYPDESLSWMKKNKHCRKADYDYKNLSSISSFVSKILEEKIFLKRVELVVSENVFYPFNLLREDLEEEIITLEKKAKQKYFSLNIGKVNFSIEEEREIEKYKIYLRENKTTVKDFSNSSFPKRRDVLFPYGDNL